MSTYKKEPLEEDVTRRRGVDDNGETDYSVMINDAMSQGGSAYGVQKLLDQRTEKALASDDTKQYAHDDIYQAAMDYISGGNPKATGGGQSAYESSYNSTIDQLLGQVLNPDPFTYDHSSDPLYQQYEKSYTKNGQRAMEDTVGQLSARTGGLGSSYAQTAGQQTYNNHMDALSARIPELEAAAYGKYMDSQNRTMGNLSMLQGLEQNEYNRHRDTVGDNQWKTSFDYGVGRDQINDGRYEKEFDYGAGRDQIADGRYESEGAYGKAFEKAQILGSAGDFSGFGALGFSEEEISNLKSAWDKSQTVRRSGGGSSGYKPRLTASQTVDAIESGIFNDEIQKSYEYWYGESYGADESGGDKLDFDALSSTAKKLAENLSRSYGGIQGKVEQIERAFNAKKLTAQEADFLMNTLGG